MARSLAFCAAIGFLFLTPDLRAGAPCCGGCGCQPCTRKICKLTCDMKEVSKNVYDCDTEDFCLPGPSKCCKSPCNCPGKCCKDHTVWKPTCGCVRTRRVLVIKQEKKKVPTYKCVVEEVCNRCGHCAKSVKYPAAEDADAALAMVKEAGIDEIVRSDMPPSSNVPAGEILPASAAVASGTGNHVFTR